MNCPEFAQLLDYIDGCLSDDAKQDVEAHLTAGCAECAASRQWYERARAVAASDDTAAPPAWALKRAFRLFEERSRRPGLAERASRLVASLIFDSSARPLLAGVRSTETANRQLLYRAGDYSLDVQVAPAEHNRAELFGQVLREGEMRFESVAGLSLSLVREGETVQTTATNEMGEFALSGVGVGQYNLVVETPDLTITVEGLPVS
ncbi:MAG TPA: hypothetical protein VNO70_20260 [Blastocatellia bacterium]|nr:hypothetical protein [Blastocatellia bacterium]